MRWQHLFLIHIGLVGEMLKLVLANSNVINSVLQMCGLEQRINVFLHSCGSKEKNQDKVLP